MRGFFFTDFEGTLLDLESRRWQAARTGLQWCRSEQVEVVPCSSQTWDETRQWRQILDLDSPSIIENGGAAVLSGKHTYAHRKGQRASGGYRFQEFGHRVEQIYSEFQQIKQQGDFHCRSVLDMSPEEFSVRTNLEVEDAEQALRREYTVPVDFLGSTSRKQEFLSWCWGADIDVYEGPEFLFLQRGCNKGTAVDWLVSCHEEEYGTIPTGAIGDSDSDIPMLKSVDYPFVVQQPDGTFFNAIPEKVSNITLIEEIGPEGWTPAADRFLDLIDEREENEND